MHARVMERGRARLSERLLRDERGFLLVELMIAVLVMSVGVIALMSTFDSSRSLSTSAEMRDLAANVGEKEVQRISALPYSKVALVAAPVQDPSNPNDPNYYIEPNGCGGNSTPPCYQWDWSTPQSSSNSEPLVIDSTNGDTTANPQSWTTVAPSGGTRFSGQTYRYVTTVSDPQCQGSTCTPSYKRVTVAVTVIGLTKPVVLSTFIRNSAGATANPLTNSGTTCTDNGSSGPCPH